MTVLAAIRPDDWNFPLFLHVLSAMVLFGAVVLAVVSVAGSSQAGVRLGFRSLLIGAIVLWAAATGLGESVRKRLSEAAPGESGASVAVESRVATMHWLRTLAVIGLLVLMVWKPGA